MNTNPQKQETAIDPLTEGHLLYRARTAFRDLKRLYGFESARQLMAEIINDCAEGR